MVWLSKAKGSLLGWDPQVNKGTEAALIQLLETGVMHADPHPGNILLGRDGKLQFIDFGLICHVDKNHQGAMLAAIAHLVNGDWQSLTEDLADMDVVKPTTDRFAVRLVCPCQDSIFLGL
jgi:aarF domain-containing kinase